MAPRSCLTQYFPQKIHTQLDPNVTCSKVQNQEHQILILALSLIWLCDHGQTMLFGILAHSSITRRYYYCLTDVLNRTK